MWYSTILLRALAACAVVPGVAAAQAYPVKPVHMVVGFVAGGGADIVARQIAQRLPEQLGQQVVVENRPGAGSAVATERVARAPADGYTLLMLSASATVLPAMRTLPYDLERDLAPVILVATGPLVLVVHPSVPAHTAGELLALARRKPGTLNYGSNGSGTPAHLSGELFAMLGKVKLVHIPYKGGGAAVIGTAGGEIDIGFPAVPAALPLLASRRIRAIAVTGQRRASALPDVPTLHEAGLAGYDLSNWNGVSAPAGVSREIVARLNAAIAKVVNMPEVREVFGRLGIEPHTGTPEAFAQFMRRELVRNVDLLRQAGVKAE